MSNCPEQEIVDNCQDPVIAYLHDRHLQEIVSAGLRRNGNKTFNIALEGLKFYDLLVLLDEFAVNSESILTVRQCVRMSDRIMEQLRAQGFYG